MSCNMQRCFHERSETKEDRYTETDDRKILPVERDDMERAGVKAVAVLLSFNVHTTPPMKEGYDETQAAEALESIAKDRAARKSTSRQLSAEMSVSNSDKLLVPTADKSEYST
jgi:hypothetical protein